MAVHSYKTKSEAVRYKATVWKDNRPIKSKSFQRKIDANQWHRTQLVLLADGMSPEILNRIRAVCSSVCSMALNLGYQVARPGAGTKWKKENVKAFGFWSTEKTTTFLNYVYQLICGYLRTGAIKGSRNTITRLKRRSSGGLPS